VLRSQHSRHRPTRARLLQHAARGLHHRVLLHRARRLRALDQSDREHIRVLAQTSAGAAAQGPSLMLPVSQKVHENMPAQHSRYLRAFYTLGGSLHARRLGYYTAVQQTVMTFTRPAHRTEPGACHLRHSHQKLLARQEGHHRRPRRRRVPSQPEHQRREHALRRPLSPHPPRPPACPRLRLRPRLALLQVPQGGGAAALRLVFTDQGKNTRLRVKRCA